MSFFTSTEIRGDSFGISKKINGAYQFLPLGTAPILEEVFESIEDDTVVLKLISPYFGRNKIAYVPRRNLTDACLRKDLGDLGFDIAEGLMHHYIDAIRIQERERESANIQPTLAYNFLGWIPISCEDQRTGETVVQPCYRCHKLVGIVEEAKYIGCYDVAPVGDYGTWQQLMIDDVIPYPALQFVLIVALSAVIVGLLALRIPIESPIVHLNLPSGRGKTTAGFLAAATACRPFEGTLSVIDEDGRIIERQSLHSSWGSTENALVASMAGNQGAVVVLNELGKLQTKNMERVIFDLSEGSDKRRLSSTLQQRNSKGYATTFLSTGESSLLEKCNSKLEGLAIRVMEVTAPLTKDAAHANRIKEGTFANCGFAAPKLAEYIIEQGGLEYVLPKYKGWVRKLQAQYPNSPNMARFVEKFSALFVTTAEIASKALSLPFDINGLLAFLEEYDREHGTERNTSATSYEIILQECTTQIHKFYKRTDKSDRSSIATLDSPIAPIGECWGRITRMAKQHTDGRLIIQEVEVRKKTLEDLLTKNGFTNKSTCIEAWKAMDVLDYEDPAHPCRKRKVDPNAEKEKVYVFRVFDEDAISFPTYTQTWLDDIPPASTSEGGDFDV